MPSEAKEIENCKTKIENFGKNHIDSGIVALVLGELGCEIISPKPILIHIFQTPWLFSYSVFSFSI
ncbi:MAG: hypothetical protein AVW06_03400 [Hadesarchaea archaeon DG-33-1]|nr:MAG: hypothetical protein AVW06_03400 [Hadesarchaea archaeon DG-33-1]